MRKSERLAFFKERSAKATAAKRAIRAEYPGIVPRNRWTDDLFIERHVYRTPRAKVDNANAE